MMEASSDKPYVKQVHLDKRRADLIAKRITPPPEVVQIRCPKCGTRWRMRAVQLH
jgi:hypothetical protein